MMIVHWPVEKRFRRITQAFGAWPERYGRFGLDGHPGVDFGVAIGTPVLASNDGELQVMWGPQLGWQCWVVAGWGQTFYAHLDSTTKPRIVRAGEVIAYSGNTGTETTGAHLHWELQPFPRNMANGFKGAVDPLLYIQEDDVANAEALSEATAVRFEIEQIVRLRQEAIKHRDNAASEAMMAERCTNQANMREAALVSTKNGRAYRVEGALGGALPKEWEG
jgi:murein DD-endopeptidase MepM/ murein hydrolase activator NlpD